MKDQGWKTGFKHFKHTPPHHHHRHLSVASSHGSRSESSCQMLKGFASILVIHFNPMFCNDRKFVMWLKHSVTMCYVVIRIGNSTFFPIIFPLFSSHTIVSTSEPIFWSDLFLQLCHHNQTCQIKPLNTNIPSRHHLMATIFMVNIKMQLFNHAYCIGYKKKKAY